MALFQARGDNELQGITISIYSNRKNDLTKTADLDVQFASPNVPEYPRSLRVQQTVSDFEDQICALLLYKDAHLYQ